MLSKHHYKSTPCRKMSRTEVVTMKNDKGVVMQLQSKQKGVRLTLATGKQAINE